MFYFPYQLIIKLRKEKFLNSIQGHFKFNHKAHFVFAIQNSSVIRTTPGYLGQI